MNKLTVYDDIFNIIPEDTTSLSDGEYEWLTTLGCKRLPASMINAIDRGEFDITTANKHSSGLIGEIYCDLNMIDCDAIRNTCSLRVMDELGNIEIYEMRKEIIPLFQDMMF